MKIIFIYFNQGSMWKYHLLKHNKVIHYQFTIIFSHSCSVTVLDHIFYKVKKNESSNQIASLQPLAEATSLILSNQPMICWLCAQGTSIVVSPDHRCSRYWGLSVNEYITLDSFVQVGELAAAISSSHICQLQLLSSNVISTISDHIKLFMPI